ncbi:succinylglutamate desuccinylase/aspartoacylase family protein [Halegenticoccus tardaugens]|uniref:succinylglutamate desuccinylase/aspartoacylase family protein n=1 Tax=Halegenticoccus tardaugens TaxID=2071624 RepID=UPI00100A71AF|nr:succinylglutamate desuccinylase/aspartoacylase family protein [Halegenticoccus tardaugens]
MEEPTNAFECDGRRVPPGGRVYLKHEITETYLSDPVSLPVTIINGDEPGPRMFLSAAIHGDELNGVEAVREVADELDHESLRGTIVCLHVVNVPGFNAQERYLPLDDSDLNRSFPGHPEGTRAQRIADRVYRTFVEPCDFGIDFHTSTRGRTNLVHVRADLADERVDRLARAFASNVIVDGAGPGGSLRRVATADGVPTITVEMGEAHRFERELVDAAVEGVKSVLAEFDMHPQRRVHWPGWRTIVDAEREKTWIRADAGGIVEMHVAGGTLVSEDERICTVTNPFDKVLTTVEAPFSGVALGTLKNPVVYPGDPICHFVRVSEGTRRVLEARRAANGSADA